MFLNIVVVMIGKSTQYLSRHSKFIDQCSQSFFAPFIVKEEDSLMRRIFAFSIPITMFSLVLVTIISLFVVLLKDKERIPAYQIPTKTFSIVANPDYRNEFLSTHSLLSFFGYFSNIAREYGVFESSLPDAEMPTIDSTIAQPVVFSQMATTVSSTPQFEVEVNKELIEFLRVHNIDASFKNRVSIAAYLGITNYVGSNNDDKELLHKLKELNDQLLKDSKVSSRPNN